LSQETKERIFEKFYRAPEAVEVNPKGVGLGLKIVKHIMSAHRGEVQADSRPQQGTTFRLIFPKD
ncbi:MAG: sensor histidine kinase, partial [Acidobacteriota bacterium]